MQTHFLHFDSKVRWDVGLNQKNIAYFRFGHEVRIMMGDELMLKCVTVDFVMCALLALCHPHVRVVAAPPI
jgi:hypothetical protein